MRKIISRTPVGVLSIALLCSGCDPKSSGSRLTPANFDQVSLGMNKTQVENILGQPTKVETKQALAFSGAESKWEPMTTYRYEDSKTFVEITFKNNQVEKKDSNLGREP